jgi:hypothetical protein
MIYLVQEFIMGEWSATIKACKNLFDANCAIEQIMGNEGLELKEFFIEGNPIYTEYWFVTDGEKTFMIQTIKLTES